MGVAPIAVPQSLAYVLNSAGAKSDVDFDYLLKTAIRESSLNPEAKASSSSAVGLFQFLDSTWLEVMKEQGPRLGYQQYADAITTDSSGDYVIKDKSLRAEVLKLREDPQIAADMAAAFTQSNGAYLQGKFGKMPSAGELYIAHFLGPKGAEKMFRAGLDDPDQVAAKLFPKQAKANPQIFYADNHARTIKEVYKSLIAQHLGTSPGAVTADDPKFVAQQMASTPASRWPTEEIPSRFSKADMSFTGFFTTESPSAPQPLIDTGTGGPLIGMEASGPLIDAFAATPASASAVDAAQALGAGDERPVDLITQDMTAALGFAPLPAPLPLVPGEMTNPVPLAPEAATPAVAEPLAAPVDLMSDIPKPRVLMTARAAVSAYSTR